MTLFLLMAIRVIILILPLVLLMLLLIKRKLKFFSIVIVIILFCNSLFMLFSNINQKNAIDVNLLNMSKVEGFFANIDINESKENAENIYIYDKADESILIATIRDIKYKKYLISNSIDDTLNNITSESAILKNVPQLLQNNLGVRCYASALKGKVDFWNLLYTNSIYKGCIIIEGSNEMYYIEYEIELYGKKSNIGTIFEQILYKSKFDDKIDIMILFESPII